MRSLLVVAAMVGALICGCDIKARCPNGEVRRDIWCRGQR